MKIFIKFLKIEEKNKFRTRLEFDKTNFTGQATCTETFLTWLCDTEKYSGPKLWEDFRAKKPRAPQKSAELPYHILVKIAEPAEVLSE